MSTTTAPKAPSFTPPAPSAEFLATQKVAQRLVDLCNAGKNIEAIRELYADNARHIEAFSMPGCPSLTTGKESLLQRAEHWVKTTKIHSASCGKPLINGDQFVCAMAMDCTGTEGPMANQRMNMTETALYTVKNGKITEAKFFYSCGM